MVLGLESNAANQPLDRFDPDRPKIPAEVVLIVAPPVTLLLCGMAVGWVIGGFRKST
jgi:hypothetical protein